MSCKTYLSLVRKMLAVCLIVAVAAAGGNGYPLATFVKAAPAANLAALILKNPKGEDIQFGTPVGFIPGGSDFDILYYDDTSYMTLSATAETAGYSVRVIFDGIEAAKAQGSVTDVRIDIPPFSHHKILSLEVLDENDDVLKTYNFKLWLSMYGTGTDGDPYQIVTADQIARISMEDSGVFQYNSHDSFKLMNDIDMTEYLSPQAPGYNDGEGWKPINFYGLFDGDGYTISGLWVERLYNPSNPSENAYNGLFGEVNNAEIKNLTLELATEGIYAGGTVGGLAGSTSNSTITDITVEGRVVLEENDPGSGGGVGGVVGQSMSDTFHRIEFRGRVTGKEKIGGLVGNLVQATPTSTFTDGYADAQVIGTKEVGGAIGVLSSPVGTISKMGIDANVNGSEQVGGLIGHINVGNSLSEVGVQGQVEATADVSYVGGLVGKVDNASISKAFTDVDVEGKSLVGGLLGNIGYGTVEDSMAIGRVTGTGKIGGLIGEVTGGSGVTISRSYATGAVSDTPLSGGLHGDSGPLFGTWNDSFWDIGLTGQSNRENEHRGGVGKTTEEMTTRSTYANWDFNTVWAFLPIGYPVLRWLGYNAPPSELTLDTASVEENLESGTVVGSLFASDPDGNDLFTFTLVDGEGSDDNGSFTIEGTSLKTAETFDYETKSSYKVRVQVEDPQGGTLQRALTISIVDVNEAPTELSLNVTEVAENAPVGTQVGLLTAIDPEGAPLTYQLVDGEGDDDNEHFTIEGNRLLTNAVFDYETKNVYHIRASVSDSVYTQEKAFTITVADLPESPTELTLSDSVVPENSPAGTVIGKFSSSDPDIGHTNVYVLVPGKGDRDNASFSIDGDTLKTNEAFDFEKQSLYTIRVAVTDSVYGPDYSYEKSFVITVTDVNEPMTEITLTSEQVAENLPAGTAVGTLGANDPDADSVLTFRLADGEGGEDNASFTIDGNILRTSAVFDYETRNSYRIRIGVTDSVYNYEAPFTILVVDVPENIDPDTGTDTGTGTPDGTPSVTIPSNDPGVEVIINGDRQNQLAQAFVDREGGKTTITVELDPAKIAERMAEESQRSVITIPITAEADRVVSRLNGEIVKLLENKEATLVVDTGAASYKLPAALFGIDAISEQFGGAAPLADIDLQVRIETGDEDLNNLLQLSADRQSFVPIVNPVVFTVRASYNGQTIEVGKFQAYVEREIRLPEGADPGRITTGIVLAPDGTVTHVPTYVVQREGRYYAVINSLSNSAYSVIWNPKQLSDAEGHWAQKLINDMASRKIVNGVDETRFEPDRFITRAEIAAILVRALGLSEQGRTNAFSDVNPSDGFYGAVARASEYGLVQGYEDGTFRPNETITREQAITMLHRAMALAGLPTAAPDADRLLRAFPDGASVSAWAQESVAAAIRAEIVNGRAFGLAPRESITRAESAALVYHLLVAANLINDVR